MRLLTCFLLSFFISGCAVTDRYAGRSEKFNKEADEFYNKVIFLNAIRASHHAPMQFTELQSVTGQTTSSGMVALSTPVGGFPAGAAPTLMPSVSGSTQTIFSAAVQNTQEFYQGVSSPLSPVQASYFVRTIGPKELLYGLIFGNVTMYRDDGECKGEKKRYMLNCTLVFQNNPRDRQNFGLFQATMEYLIRLGFSMDSVQLTNDDRTTTQNVGKGTTEIKSERKDENVRQVARYCFRPRLNQDDELITSADFICGRSNTAKFFRRTENEFDQSPTLKLDDKFIEVLNMILTDPEVLQAYKSDDSDPDDNPVEIRKTLRYFRNQIVRVELSTRSTLDIFNYIGNIIGQQRKVGASPLLIRSNVVEKGTLPCNFASAKGCLPILLVSEREEGSSIAVEYDDAVYGLVSDKVQENAGLYTIAILKRILGLNTSSKNTPAPVILTSAPPL